MENTDTNNTATCSKNTGGEHIQSENFRSPYSSLTLSSSFSHHLPVVLLGRVGASRTKTMEVAWILIQATMKRLNGANKKEISDIRILFNRFEATHKPYTKDNTSQQFNEIAVAIHSSYFCGAFHDWKSKGYIKHVTDVNSAETGF